MIKWTDIDNEVEEFQSGYRAGFVAIFKKYEGMETDERTAQKHVVKVSVESFSRRYGIAKSTFQGWLKMVDSPGSGDSRNRPGPTQRAIDEAAAAATAAAEAKAAKTLADSLAKAERAKREALLAQKQEQERQAKAEAARIRKEEQEKAAAAAKKEMDELKAKLAEKAKAAQFDMSTLSEAQKREVLTILANDPDMASDWFKARDAERKRKTEAAEKARLEREAKLAETKEKKAKAEALDRARKDYEGSPLWFFNTKVMPIINQMNTMLDTHKFTLDHLIVSQMSAQEVVFKTEQTDEVMEKLRDAVYLLNAEMSLKAEGK